MLVPALPLCTDVCYTLFVASSSRHGKEVCVMENVVQSFILSVAAGVVCHYLCRWLDERVHGNKPER